MADKTQFPKSSPAELSGEARRTPAAERNTGAILKVLAAHLPASGRALEIASGTGQHAAAFAQNFPAITWTPSDPAPDARRSIAAWVGEAGLENLKPPLDLDVMREHWPAALKGPFDAVLAINLVHISPWAACEGLLRGAGALLQKRGMLYLYGPYRRGGAHTADSNARFEEWLHGQNREWGVRDIGEVERAAATHGLALDAVIAMPANNFSLILRKS